MGIKHSVSCASVPTITNEPVSEPESIEGESVKGKSIDDRPVLNLDRNQFSPEENLNEGLAFAGLELSAICKLVAGHVQRACS